MTARHRHVRLDNTNGVERRYPSPWAAGQPGPARVDPHRAPGEGIPAEVTAQGPRLAGGARDTRRSRPHHCQPAGIGPRRHGASQPTPARRTYGTGGMSHPNPHSRAVVGALRAWFQHCEDATCGRFRHPSRREARHIAHLTHPGFHLWTLRRGRYWRPRPICANQADGAARQAIRLDHNRRVERTYRQPNGWGSGSAPWRSCGSATPRRMGGPA
jgi:hypothetical protein